METKFVLASRSPRRRELLARMGVADFLVEEADIDAARACIEENHAVYFAIRPLAGQIKPHRDKYC